MEEFIIEVNKNDKRIGVRKRSDFYTGKFIHRGSGLLLFNTKGQVLLQKRAKTKRWFPNTFDFSASGTVATESYRSTIIREVKEELGISVVPKRLFKYKSFNDNNKSFQTLFSAVSDNPIHFQKEEIIGVKWVSLDNLKKDIYKNSKNYSPSFIEGMIIFLKKYSKKVKKT